MPDTKPKLPEPAVMCDCGGNYYTEEQMRATWNAAIEAAAKTNEAWGAARLPSRGGAALRNAASAIRAMKEPQ